MFENLRPLPVNEKDVTINFPANVLSFSFQIKEPTLPFISSTRVKLAVAKCGKQTNCRLLLRTAFVYAPLPNCLSIFICFGHAFITHILSYLDQSFVRSFCCIEEMLLCMINDDGRSPKLLHIICVPMAC